MGGAELSQAPLERLFVQDKETVLYKNISVCFQLFVSD